MHYGRADGMFSSLEIGFLGIEVQTYIEWLARLLATILNNCNAVRLKLSMDLGVITNVYFSLCQLVLSKLQEETDKCKNRKKLSNTFLWTLLICFPFLISYFYFYFCAFEIFYVPTVSKHFTFRKCWIIIQVFLRPEMDEILCITNLNPKKLFS